MNIIKLEQKIITDFSGYKRLIKFYQDCTEFNNETLYIDFTNLEWIDANLCALFEAIFYKLSVENNLQFATDLELLQKKFDVLFRNGFIVSDKKFEDKQKSTMPAMNFLLSDKSGFVNYIQTHLMKHKGMPKAITDSLKEKIVEDLIEIFCNSHLYAKSEYPFFVSGQYYHKQKYLCFTMVDLGQGFLPRISKATSGNIDSSLKAITWALEGNSSKLPLDGIPGGLGLSRILKYCNEHNGQLDVITGDGYWSSAYENNILKGGRLLDEQTFVGTTINLSFKN